MECNDAYMRMTQNKNCGIIRPKDIVEGVSELNWTLLFETMVILKEELL